MRQLTLSCKTTSQREVKTMVEDTKPDNPHGVDKGLVAMFLRMSPEERLRANDNALRAILELRHAYKQRRTHERRSRRNS